MSDTTDTSADERIQTLIRERNQARSDLQEARAQIAELTEQQTAIKAEAERAAVSGRAELEAKVATMEAQLRRGSNRELLLADKIPSDQMDDLLEYLDYQYSRIPSEEGQTRPEFKDWYAEARKTNKVLRAAMKPSVRESATDQPEVEATAAVQKPRPAVPAAKPANVVASKPGDNGRDVDLSKIRHGTPEWSAAKERLQRQVFTRGA
jgi:chromosome segregation ATPase